MRPLITIFSFLVLTSGVSYLLHPLQVPLLVLAQSQESSVNSIGVLFQNDTLPASCNVHIGVDWYAGDMIPAEITGVDNPGECCRMCRDRRGCRAWLWRSDRDHCWLKGTVNRPSLCPACVGGIFHDVASVDPEICNPQEGTGWDGPDLEVRIGTTVGDCCDACNQSLNCTRWTYRNTTSPRCFLKRGNAREINCTNCVSGRNEENIRLDEGRCNVVQGIDWFQGDINEEPYENVTISGCCELCQNMEECRAWLYRTRWNRCYLKDNVRSPSECLDCIGGIVG